MEGSREGDTRGGGRWRLRRATVGDLAVICRLENVCFAEGMRDGRSVIRRSLLSSSQEVWVTGEDSCWGGVLFLRFFTHTVRIYSIAVDPAVEGRGLGTALLRQAEKRAREVGASRLSLEVRAGHEPLRRWYERNGFHPTRRLPAYYATGEDGIRMIKPLARRPLAAGNTNGIGS